MSHSLKFTLSQETVSVQTDDHIGTCYRTGGDCNGLEPRGCFLVNCVPMSEQRTAKLTLNIVSDILKFIHLFIVSSQKVTQSNEVNSNAYSRTSATFCKIVKSIPFFYKKSIFPTLNDDSPAHCPARKEVPFLMVFWFLFLFCF